MVGFPLYLPRLVSMSSRSGYKYNPERPVNKTS